SCINDFVSGEIEHAVVSAWKNEKPDLIVIEGQGSLMNPAYPGGFEILAAGRPDYVVLQHAPRRLEYDGFPGYKLHSLKEQIKAIETISGKKVIAVTLNHENMKRSEITNACFEIMDETGLPCFDVLEHGADDLAEILQAKMKGLRASS
ncbi:MAG: putative NAD-dependent epimerase/dehydratase family protein, partial [Saprospiraceae bacterium]